MLLFSIYSFPEVGVSHTVTQIFCGPLWVKVAQGGIPFWLYLYRGNYCHLAQCLLFSTCWYESGFNSLSTWSTLPKVWSVGSLHHRCVTISKHDSWIPGESELRGYSSGVQMFCILNLGWWAWRLPTWESYLHSGYRMVDQNNLPSCFSSMYILTV